MSKPNQLFLLADHIKLSLLERQRAQALDLGDDAQDGHISRSLDQFREGLEAMKEEERKLTESGDDSAQSLTEALPSLQKQYSDLTSQFHGFATPSTTETLTHPNSDSLAEDFAHAQSTTSTSPRTSTSTSQKQQQQHPKKTTLRTPSSTSVNNPPPKTVRFSDSQPQPSSSSDPEAQLFGPYRDDPSNETEGYRDSAASMDNEQLHAYHSRILQDQDDHLDRLGESIGRQRELSMQIGDELDSHVAMLDDVDSATDRHQGRLDRARRSLGRVASSAGESKQMMIIIGLIVILVLLIAVFK